MLETVTKSVLYGLFLRTPEGIAYLFIIYHYYDKFIYFFFKKFQQEKVTWQTNKLVINKLETS